MDYDAYFAVGIEIICRSGIPRRLCRMLRSTGAQTDQQTGVSKLELTAGKGHYMAQYARLLLAVVDLREHAPDC
jgi:hypothetical protein